MLQKNELSTRTKISVLIVLCTSPCKEFIDVPSLYEKTKVKNFLHRWPENIKEWSKNIFRSKMRFPKQIL